MANKEDQIINHDSQRHIYTGIPEVILAEPKTPEQVILAIEKAIEKNHSVLISRIQEDQRAHIDKFASLRSQKLLYDQYKRTAIVGEYIATKASHFKSAILSAGTSDDYLVEEIGFILSYFGFDHVKYADIGVAGIHRHRTALKEIEKDETIKIVIVVAGQDGALFPVISAQTKLPVVAVPTSIGYGFGGKGLTAFQTAIQSCSPGVVVVNIDNGFGAATFVAKLLSLFK